MMPSINLILSSLFFVVLISELVTANFDPTGSLKQVEYAVKATAKGSTLIAIATTTDVILVSYNQKTDNSVVKQEKIKKISPYFVVGGAGLISDVSYLTNKIFEETLDYSSTFGSSPPIRKIASEIAELMHERTLIAAYRPFGAALCLAGLDDEVSPVLFEIDPTGSLRRKKLSSIGLFGSRVLSKWPKDKDPSAIDSCEAVKCCCDVLRECCKDDEQVLELKHLEIVTIRKGKPFTKVPYELNEQQNDINFDSLRSFFDQNALEES